MTLPRSRSDFGGRARHLIANPPVGALGMVAAALGLILAARSAYYGWLLHRPMPFWDQWSAIRDYFLFADGRFTATRLFALHNEHRLVTSRPFFILDGYLTGLQGWFCTLVIYASLLGLAVTLALQAARAIGDRRSVILLAPVMLGLTWSICQFENLSWGFQLAFPFVHWFALLALIALAEALTGTRRNLWLAAACLFGFLTVFSFANGLLLTGAAVAVIVWLRRLDWRCAVFLGCQALWTAGFFYGFARPQDPNLTQVSATALDYVAFALTYLGNPFRLAPQLFLPLGLAIAALFLAASLSATRQAVLRREPVDRAVAVLLGLALFVALEAAATSYGRATIGPLAATASRYSSASIVMVAALIAIGWRISGASRQGRAIVLVGAIAAVAGANLPPDNLAGWRGLIDRRDQAAFALASGVRADEAVSLIHFSPKGIARDLDRLAAGGLANFSPEASVYRPPLQALTEAAVARAPACRVVLGGVAQTSGAIRVRGKVAPPADVPGSVSWIVAQGAAGQVLGFTRPLVGRRSPMAPGEVGSAEFDLFLNPARLGTQDPSTVALLALLDLKIPGKGRAICRADELMRGPASVQP
ncbi:MAG TPA: hypothetical protein VIL09_16865 [Microvirga sp.]|jgi:hypothetical protein